MNRTTDGLPPKADGSNWLIVVSNGKGSTAAGSVSVRVIGPVFLPVNRRA
jgi:hypothetical protein